MRRFALLAFAALLLPACWNGVRPEPRLEFGTVHSEFDRGAAGSVAVPVRARNTGDVSWFIGQCGEHFALTVERWDGTAWTQESAAICPANLPSAPLELRKGETRDDTRVFTSAGRFRLRVPVGLGPEFMTGEGVSDAFDVH